MSRVRKTVGSLTFAGLCGAVGYFGADAASDLVVYYACKRLIEERAATNPLLVQQLGPPLHPGKWYNSSVGVSHGGFIGTATIAVAGSRHSSDVIITISRKASRLRSPLLHAMLDGGPWDVMTLDAVLQDGSGMTRRVSLLDPPPAQRSAGKQAGGQAGGGSAPADSSRRDVV